MQRPPTSDPRPSEPARPKPEVRELIADFGSIERGRGWAWLALRPHRLPAYMRHLPAAREAKGWAMLVTAAGSGQTWIRLQSNPIQGPRRKSA